MAYYKGINYIGKQRKEGVCVAISIINALKWAGNKTISASHIEHVYKKAGNPGEGTVASKVLKVLRFHCKKYLIVTYSQPANSQQVIQWLREGNTAILDYFCVEEKDSEIGHSIFLSGIESDKVVIINDFGKSIYKMNVKRFKKELFKKSDNYPGVYFIRKTNALRPK